MNEETRGGMSDEMMRLALAETQLALTRATNSLKILAAKLGNAEGRAKTAQLVANHYGIGEVYGSLDEMLAKADLDAGLKVLQPNF